MQSAGELASAGTASRDAAAICGEPRRRFPAGASQCRPAPPAGAGARSARARARDAAIVSGSSWMPGRDSIASARSGGSASFRARKRDLGLRSGSGSRSSTERDRFSDSLANAPAVMFRFVIRSASSSSRAAELLEDDAGVGRSSAPGRAAPRREGRRRRSPSRVPAGPPYLKASFSDSAAVSPWTIASWVAVVRGGRLVGQARSRSPRAGAGGRRALRLAERRQNLVELDGGRGLRDRDLAAVLELRRAGAARPHVEEEVALEEEPRPDLELGVRVDRLALLGHGERDLRGVARGLDVDDLADVDAGDPDRRGLAKRGGVLERRASPCTPGRSTAASWCTRGSDRSRAGGRPRAGPTTRGAGRGSGDPRPADRAVVLTGAGRPGTPRARADQGSLIARPSLDLGGELARGDDALIARHVPDDLLARPGTARSPPRTRSGSGSGAAVFGYGL